VSIDAASLGDRPGSVVVSIHERSIARKIDHQLVHRNAARSVTAMAAMLAAQDGSARNRTGGTAGRRRHGGTPDLPVGGEDPR